MIEDLRAEYEQAVAVEQFAIRQRKEATAALLWALGVRPRYSTLFSTSERSTSWRSNLDVFSGDTPLPPSARKKVRALRFAGAVPCDRKQVTHER